MAYPLLQPHHMAAPRLVAAALAGAAVALVHRLHAWPLAARVARLPVRMLA